MKKMRWLALVLAVVLLFTGCSGKSFHDLWLELSRPPVTPFAEMQYTRPDPAKMETELEKCLSLAETEDTTAKVVSQVWVVYNLYNTFYTNYHLATIYYFRDMTDNAWKEEYTYCLQNAPNYNAMLEEMFYALADCPLRDKLEADPSFGEGFFDQYEGDSVWDETLLQLMEQEAALEEKYHKISTDAQSTEYYSEEFFTRYGTQMLDVFVELIKVRQEMAGHLGYPDYASFAYDFYHRRDYTPQQAETYLQSIGTELVPLYRSMDLTEDFNRIISQEQVFSYVESAAEAMGGIAWYAFTDMRDYALYDLTYSDKKYDGSFEIYLTDYSSPFVFVNPTGYTRDKLSFAHEFGHYCSDYAARGSYAGVDVSEIFSQGFEYLSLCYGAEAGQLTQLKMQDCLCIFVEQSAYALFEHQVYELKGDRLTAENILALYESISTQFGFDVQQRDPRELVLIPHFFTEPMYIVSYVTSNDAALQLYQLEQTEKGSGLALWEANLATAEAFPLAFLESAGLTSPFAPGRIAQIRETLEQALASK